MFHILHFESIDSTNTYAKANITNLNHYDVIWADYQTRGRGRRDHQWMAPKMAHVMTSIIIKEEIEANRIQQLTQVCAVSVWQLCQSLGIKAKIKWPNDIYVKDKKLVGILIESVFEKELQGIVIGTGINVKDEGLPSSAVCLQSLGSPLGIKETLDSFLHYFNENYQLFKAGEYEQLLKIANEHAYLKNKTVYLQEYGKVEIGNLLADGRIEIIKDDQLHYIHVNEFSLAKK
ncbi:MAG: biotin--[acetyl-CoA-carboxylase] ligase [Beduini sp.]|uniref:biotin--[acetyl-CoA-carboxylase] ligase n=1 Tax=Beduini sp. TaxID=1922300 RepID=UPI0039A19D56